MTVNKDLLQLAQMASVFRDNVESHFINDPDFAEEFHSTLTPDEEEIVSEFNELEKAQGYDTTIELLEKSKIDCAADKILTISDIYVAALSRMVMPESYLIGMIPKGLRLKNDVTALGQSVAPKLTGYVLV